MYKKRLLTAVLCGALAMAVCGTGSGATENGKTAGKSTAQVEERTLSAENEQEKTKEKTQEKKKEEAQSQEAGEPAKKQAAAEEPKARAAAEEPKAQAAAEEPQTQAPTEAPQTQAPTEAPQTQAPTEAPQTQAPTEAPQTQAPTAEPQTQAPAEAPQTQAPTEDSQTQAPSEGQTQAPSESETQASPETQPGLPEEMRPPAGFETESESQGITEPAETETPGQTGTEGSESESENESEMESEPETESELESESESETDPEMEEESESETSEYSSNEELIAHQNIVIPPDISLEFRFTQVEKRYGLVNQREGAPVYEEKSESARQVGELEYYGLCYILEDNSDGWYYVESGNVRGFVKADVVTADEVAERIVTVKGEEALPAARLIVARTENVAFTYTHTTVRSVLADKQYALAKKSLSIREQRKDSARVIGTLAEGGLCYLLADEDKEWVYVESGDVRGFVKASELVTGASAAAQVSGTGENNMTLADQQVAPEDNKACYYTLTSVREASQEARTREAIVNFSLQFLGNPYVWGGTSLTNGCDCSGFVQSIYGNFGYSLPRVACDQSVYGMQIPISSAEPGDLIFYAKNGYVYHVSMYIGGGQVIHAAGKNVGIITSGISGNAVWATRVITG